MAELTSPPLAIGRRVSAGVLGASAVLCGYSLIMVFSATHTSDGSIPKVMAPYFPKQIAWVVIGLVLATLMSLVDYSRLQHYFPQLYVLNLVLLVAVFVVGDAAKGAQRWIPVGPFTLQPSEFAKLFVVVTLASYIAHKKGRIDDMREVGITLGLIAPPMLLIMLQPDLGTALVIGAIWLGMMFAAGLRWQYLLGVAVVALAVLLLAWQLHVLKDYQISRLIVFVDPKVDPSGAGYNLNQSKIAIGSGGLMGKGLRSGTQTNLNFLPERHTDFIFAVLGEKLGFVGAALLLLFYGWLLMSGLRVASASRDLFGTLVATGIVTMWTFQVMVNMGMTTGIMPVTGIPLPFMSYGGSSMWTHLVAAGLLMSIWAHRHPGSVG
jgi:rod shape determining protein RodA